MRGHRIIVKEKNFSISARPPITGRSATLCVGRGSLGRNLSNDSAESMEASGWVSRPMNTAWLNRGETSV